HVEGERVLAMRPVERDPGDVPGHRVIELVHDDPCPVYRGAWRCEPVSGTVHARTAAVSSSREGDRSAGATPSCRSRSVMISTTIPMPIRIAATTCSPGSLTRARNAMPVMVA